MLVNYHTPRHVYIVCGNTDLRKGIDTLTISCFSMKKILLYYAHISSIGGLGKYLHTSHYGVLTLLLPIL